jgi:hypothetical protein
MKPSVDVPTRLREVLEKNRTLNAAVDLTIDDFSTWASQHTNLTFFPEYTDHGPAHLSAVLETTASELIPCEAIALLTPDDVAAYTVAVLLHD